jgi:translation initiation factor 6
MEESLTLNYLNRPHFQEIMHILITDFQGNPNVGLYGFATDEYCLLGKDVSEEKAKEISKVLEVPTHRINICGTSLVGVFVTGNTNKLLVPSIAFESELKVLEKLKIDYEVIETKLTALGNNILCNDNGALVNPDFPATVKKRIRQALNVQLKPGTIARMHNVGSLSISHQSKCVIHRDADKEDMEIIRELLNLEVELGTVNMGSPYLRSGIICNSNGFIVGESSGGPEIAQLDESLGFLDKEL